MTGNNPTLDYFEEYRKKKRELESLADEHQRIKTVADEIRTKARNLEEEIASMKRIMTLMIDNGIDPVEAKLKTEPSSLVDSFWDSRIYDDTIQDLSISSSDCVYTTMIDLNSTKDVYGSLTYPVNDIFSPLR